MILKLEIEKNSKLQTIKDYTNSNCKELKVVRIPSNFESIGELCFLKSNVVEIYIQSHKSIKFQQNCVHNFKIYSYEDCKLIGEQIFTIDECSTF